MEKIIASSLNQIVKGDAIEEMKKISDNSIDMTFR